MDTSSPIQNNRRAATREFFAEPATRYTLIVSFSISAVMLLEALYPPFAKALSSLGFYALEQSYPIFVTDGDRAFSQGFIEWFGTFYGFFLPLLLVRAWEQLDAADREFDREADSIKVLLEDFMLLDDDFLDFKKNMVTELQKYVEHVLNNYQDEHQKPHEEKAIPTATSDQGANRSEAYLNKENEKKKTPKQKGDELLQEIRRGYKELIYKGGGSKAKRLEPVTTELLERLNEAIDIRGDRIAIFGERLFESLWTVAIVTSVIWLIPFYFVPLQLGPLGGLLKLAVTFLIIFVLTIIHDLDEPFRGIWKVNTATWEEVQEEISGSLAELDSRKSQENNGTSVVGKMAKRILRTVFDSLLTKQMR